MSAFVHNHANGCVNEFVPWSSGPARGSLDRKHQGSNRARSTIYAKCIAFSGWARRNRTFNKRTKRPLLCQLSYAPVIQFSVCLRPACFRPSGAPEVSRTPNPRLRRPMPYPVELRAQKETRNDAQALRGCQGRFPAVYEAIGMSGS